MASRIQLNIEGAEGVLNKEGRPEQENADTLRGAANALESIF
jgi:hypothetical protein